MAALNFTFNFQLASNTTKLNDINLQYGNNKEHI